MNKGYPCAATLQELVAVPWAQVLSGGSLASSSAVSAEQKGLQDRDAQILKQEETTAMNESSLLHNTGQESYSAFSPSCGPTKEYLEKEHPTLVHRSPVL